MITQKQFDKKCAEFDVKEPRAGIYDKCLGLVRAGSASEGALFLNAFWNIATFKYYAAKFNVDEFDKLIAKIYPAIQKINSRFEYADFKSLESEIGHSYLPLSAIRGIDYTGAAKIMHLFKPELFIPWDQYMREEYLGNKNKTSVKDYIDYLEKMQKNFMGLQASEGKTLPKAIDEYNYVTISIPAVERENRKRERLNGAKKGMKKDPDYKKLKKKYL
jgi:hypothetical protein